MVNRKREKEPIILILLLHDGNKHYIGQVDSYTESDGELYVTFVGGQRAKYSNYFLFYELKDELNNFFGKD